MIGCSFLLASRRYSIPYDFVLYKYCNKCFTAETCAFPGAFACLARILVAAAISGRVHALKYENFQSLKDIGTLSLELGTPPLLK